MSGEKIYRDVPISDRPDRPVSLDRPIHRIPHQIRAIRSLQISFERPFPQERESVFVHQAQLLHSYEDDFYYPYQVIHYYPTFASLTDEELRGYVGWRTRLRKGQGQAESLTYAYLYIYEIINQIGISEPRDGFSQLTDFFSLYGSWDPHILKFKDQWLQDYVVYYQLDSQLLPPGWDLAWDQELWAFEHPFQADDKTLSAAMMAASGLNLSAKSVYKKHGDLLDAALHVMAGVFRQMTDHYSRRRKNSLFTDYFGSKGTVPYDIFETVPLYKTKKYKNRDYDYAVDRDRIFHSSHGWWSVTGYDHPRGRNIKMHKLVDNLDRCIRLHYNLTRASERIPQLPAWMNKIINDELVRWDQHLAALRRQTVTVDLSQLESIRSDAAVTRDKLIVEEETDAPAEADGVDRTMSQAANFQAADFDMQEHCPGADRKGRAEENGQPGEEGLRTSEDKEDKEESISSGPALLNPQEVRLLSCLLRGDSLDWVKHEGEAVSLLVDSINTKLYDQFLDTVIEGDDSPQIIEDYRDDVESLIAMIK